MRVWQLDTTIGQLKTWKRVEYNTNRVDEFGLVEDGRIVDDHLESHVGRN